MRINDFEKQRGQSLVEVLIAIAIAALVVGSGVGALIVTLKSNLQNRNTQVASTLGQELLDNVRSVAGGNWTQIYNISPKGPANNYYLTPSMDLVGTVAVTNGSPNVAGTGTTFTADLIVGDYAKIAGQIFKVSVITDNTSLTLDSNYMGATGSGFIAHRDFRVSAGTQNVAFNNLAYAISFTVDNVNRDSCGTGSITASFITSCSGGAGSLSGILEDPSTQKVTAKIAWTQNGSAANVLISEYLTRSKNEVNKFTDWSGSSGVGGPVTQPAKDYFSQSGLDTTATPGSLQLAP